MKKAKDYVLNLDAKEDMRKAWDSQGLSNAVTMRIKKAFLDPTSYQSDTSVLLIPVGKKSSHSIGIGVIERCRYSGGENTKTRSRNYGRYICSESGELLIVNYPVDNNNILSPMVNIHWFSSLRGFDTCHRESVSIDCDVETFNGGKLLESVTAAEIERIEGTGRVDWSACRDAQGYTSGKDMPTTQKWLENCEMTYQKHEDDLPNFEDKLKMHCGVAAGQTTRISAPQGIAGISGLSMATMTIESSLSNIWVGRDECILSTLLATYFEAHPFSLGESGWQVDFGPHVCNTNSANMFTAGEECGWRNPSTPADESAQCVRGERSSNRNTTRGRFSIKKPSPVCVKHPLGAAADTRRKMSNRASAARSNARRKEAFEGLKRELAEARDDFIRLERKDQELREENLRLRRIMKSSRKSLVLLGYTAV